jgi:hypothetical protein
VVFAVDGWINACSRGCIRSHGLVTIFAEEKLVFFFAIMHTLHDLGAHQRAFADDALHGNHVVKMDGAQGSRVACVFAKAANKSAVVCLIHQHHVVNGRELTSAVAFSRPVRPCWLATTSASALSKHGAYLNGSLMRL